MSQMAFFGVGDSGVDELTLFRRKPKCKHEYVAPIAAAPRSLTGIEKHWAEIEARERVAAREAEQARAAPLAREIAKLKSLLADAERELYGEAAYLRMHQAALQQNMNPTAAIWNMTFNSSNPYVSGWEAVIGGLGK